MSKSQIVFDVIQHQRTQIDHWKKDAANWGQRALRVVSLIAIAAAPVYIPAPPTELRVASPNGACAVSPRASKALFFACRAHG